MMAWILQWDSQGHTYQRVLVVYNKESDSNSSGKYWTNLTQHSITVFPTDNYQDSSVEEFEDEDVEDAELKDDEDEGSKKSKKQKEKKGCKDIDNKRKMKPAVGMPAHNRHKAVEITANSLEYMSLYPYHFFSHMLHSIPKVNHPRRRNLLKKMVLTKCGCILWWNAVATNQLPPLMIQMQCFNMGDSSLMVRLTWLKWKASNLIRRCPNHLAHTLS